MKSIIVIGSLIAFLVLSSSYSFQANRPETNSAVAAPITSQVYFAPDVVYAGVGETFTVKVMFHTDVDLYGHEIVMNYSRSILEFVEAELPSWEFISGKYGLLFWVAGTEAQSGEVELLTFTFKAKATGACVLWLSYHQMATLHWVLPTTEVGWPIIHNVAGCTVSVS